ncbi:hypothetical protein QWY14_10495 [Planococcus sp. N028]|uniref:Uncharacterized protein n=1 Tax=Planococcus shixiaomingii TaxID=3058393 RepID=A0ABT8N2Z0_9BACL|nr:hypothetical protein [Planococcus sp. N028]MDN7242230.1 hypothetical protein [Planococcus sp. N028]
MLRRFILVLLIVSAVLLVLFLSYTYTMLPGNDPTPSKHDAEKLVRAYDLKKFGSVESSYLHTPKNFAFYNEHHIYVVERALGRREEYVDRHAVIAIGEELTAAEEKLAEAYEDYLTSTVPSIKEVRVLSKHEVTVYENGEEIHSEWLFKEVSVYEEQTILTFTTLQLNTDGSEINLFADGYEQFLDF